MGELKKENLMKGLFGDFNDETPEKTEAYTIATEDIVIPIDKLLDFHTEIVDGKSHFFKRLNPKKHNEVKRSIMENGLLYPIKIRRDKQYEGCYETIAGHNRRDILKELGWTELSTKKNEIEIIDVNDEEATVIMMESNRQRDEQDIIETAWAYRIELELLNRKAGRRSNASQIETQERSDQILAEKVGTTRATLQRVIRLTYLIEPLQEAVIRKSNKIKQGVAYEFSFLSPEQQEVIAQCIDEGYRISATQAKEIRENAENSFLSTEEIQDILLPISTPTLKNVIKATEKHFRKMDIDADKLSRIDEASLQILLQNTIESYLDEI